MARKEKTIHYIYKTTCNITGRWYIGMHSTNNLDDGYLGSGKRLRKSIRKYGKDNHTKEILEFLSSREELAEREREIVNKELLYDIKCMNLTIGGEAGGFINEKHMVKCSKAGNLAYIEKLNNDEEFRNMISIKYSNIRKREFEEGIREKKAFYDWTGRNHSDESKKLISNNKKGKKTGDENHMYGTCWVTKNSENKKIKKEDLDLYINEGWIKGRVTPLKGELVKNSKLKEKDVLIIKELLKSGELTQNKIGEMFGVNKETISKIKRGVIWKNS